MKKILGFSLVELVVVVGVSLILALISIPEITSWYKRDRFVSQTEEIIDTLYDARAAALSEKKCSDGNSSTLWEWSMYDGDIELICHYSSGTQTEKTASLDENITFAESFLYFKETGSALWTAIDLETKILINFSSGNAQAHITAEDGVTRSTYDIRKIELPFRFSGLEDIKRTICFDRIAGFPTISPTEDCYD